MADADRGGNNPGRDGEAYRTRAGGTPIAEYPPLSDPAASGSPLPASAEIEPGASASPVRFPLRRGIPECRSAGLSPALRRPAGIASLWTRKAPIRRDISNRRLGARRFQHPLGANRGSRFRPPRGGRNSTVDPTTLTAAEFAPRP